MSFSFSLLASKTKDDQLRSGELSLARTLFEIGFTLRCWRARLRAGELSRAPLRLLRFEVSGNAAECEWIARPPDPWDSDLRPEIRMRHASEQALRDAIAVRRLIFTLMPDLDEVTLRIYRETSAGRELIVAGQVPRYTGLYRPALSTAMRAKLLGLCFVLENGILCGSVTTDAARPHDLR
jgi:hypothetical protein